MGALDACKPCGLDDSFYHHHSGPLCVEIQREMPGSLSSCVHIYHSSHRHEAASKPTAPPAPAGSPSLVLQIPMLAPLAPWWACELFLQVTCVFTEGGCEGFRWSLRVSPFPCSVYFMSRLSYSWPEGPRGTRPTAV